MKKHLFSISSFSPHQKIAKIILILGILLCIPFSSCYGQKVKDQCDFDNPNYGCKEMDQRTLDNTCQEGERRSSWSQKRLLDTLTKSRNANCAKFTGQPDYIKPDVCNMSTQEFRNAHIGVFPMCQLYIPEYDNICDDPSNFTPNTPGLQSNCPCPGGIEVTQNGCSINVTCKIGGDYDTTVTVSSPCPEVRGSDPQYPLVKMLSGTLIEWNEPAQVTYSDFEVTYDAPGGTSGPGDHLHSAYYGGLFYQMVVSSVDLGQGVRFDINAANAKKNAKERLDRKNINYQLIGGNPNVEILTQNDIYKAYKDRSKYVQAYLVLSGKNYGERPWTTYEKFVEGMCKMSANKSRCKKELSYNAHQDTEMQGNLYLGSGNTSIIGLYSEISSHNCHGATVVTPEGPAFGIVIDSTWCFYLHATWADYSEWLVTKCEFIRNCCVEAAETIEYEWVEESFWDVDEKGNRVEHVKSRLKETPYYTCLKVLPHYAVTYGWVSAGAGESTGDCGICATAEGYKDPSGNYTNEPYPVSFFQSQPLLIK